MEDNNNSKNNKKNSGDIFITPEGLKKNKEELAFLINDERPKVQEALKEARAQGDLSENADYDAAKNKQSEIENKITRLENIITNSKLIKKVVGKITVVDLGEIVTYKKKNGEKITIKIVDSVESDPFQKLPLISMKSPIGSALLGQKIGDVVKINAPKSFQVTILDIKKS